VTSQCSSLEQRFLQGSTSQNPVAALQAVPLVQMA
jgi:hypothetical protein